MYPGYYFVKNDRFYSFCLSILFNCLFTERTGENRGKNSTLFLIWQNMTLYFFLKKVFYLQNKWRQELQMMASSKYASTRETTNLARVARIILGPCTDVPCAILKKEISPSFPINFVTESLQLFSQVTKRKTTSNYQRTGKDHTQWKLFRLWYNITLFLIAKYIEHFTSCKTMGK